MQATSTEFFNKINSLSQRTCLKASLTYKNASGEIITEELIEDDFFGDGVKTVSDCMSSGDFTFGGTVCKEITCTLDNTKEKYYGCNFTDGKIIVHSGLILDDGTEEYVKLGEFNLSKAGKPATTVKLTGYDNMLKFDVAMGDYSETPLTTIGAVINAACDVCGVELSPYAYSNSGISITPEFDSTTTWREIIGWCAAAAGGFARINRDGQLEIVSFAKENAYEINPETTRLSIEVEDHHEITGLIYYGKKEPIIFGTKTYPIIIEENDIFEMMSEADLSTILEGLYNNFVGHIYCGFTLNYLGNPALDEGDYLYLPSAQGDDVYALCGKCEFKHMGKSTLSCPGVSFYDKQYDQGNREKKEEEEQIATGKNLLLISKFTRAFLPYGFVGKWSYTYYNTYGVECLDTYMMCEKFNRIWLPFQGDIKPEQKYTLSLLMKSRDSRRTPTYTVCLVPSYTVCESEVVLNSLADKVKAPVDDNSATFILGTITLSAEWEWHTLTFTAPSNLPYQDDVTGDISGLRGYMLALYADQNGLYGASYVGNYAAHLHKAKLEEGSMATDWCLGESEKAALHESLDDSGRTTNTIASVVNSLVAVYGEHQLEIAPTTIHYNENDKIMVMRQKRTGDTDIVNQILLGEMILNTGNASLEPANFISLYNGIGDKTLHISAPGGLFINGTEYVAYTGESEDSGCNCPTVSLDEVDTGVYPTKSIDNWAYTYSEYTDGTLDAMTPQELYDNWYNGGDGSAGALISNKIDYYKSRADVSEFHKIMVDDWYAYINNRFLTDSTLVEFVREQAKAITSYAKSKVLDFVLDMRDLHKDKYDLTTTTGVYPREKINYTFYTSEFADGTLDSETIDSSLYSWYVNNIQSIADKYRNEESVSAQEKLLIDEWYIYINNRYVEEWEIYEKEGQNSNLGNLKRKYSSSSDYDERYVLDMRNL